MLFLALITVVVEIAIEKYYAFVVKGLTSKRELLILRRKFF